MCLTLPKGIWAFKGLIFNRKRQTIQVSAISTQTIGKRHPRGQGRTLGKQYSR